MKVGAAPGVNRLRVVAYDHDIAMLACEQVDQIGLDFVRILVLVDEDELELPSIKRGDVFMLLHHRQRLFEQIIKIDGVGRFFLFLVARVNVGDFFEQRQKVRKLSGQ